MPQYENVRVALVVPEGQMEFPEYRTQIDESARTVTTYVPSRVGLSFWVRLIITDLRRINSPENGTPFLDCSYEAQVFMDGSHTLSTAFFYEQLASWGNTLYHSFEGSVVFDAELNKNVELKWEFQIPADALVGEFEAMEIDPKPNMDALTGKVAAVGLENGKVGTIEVKIWRCKITGPDEDRPLPTTTVKQASAPTPDIQHTIGFPAAEEGSRAPKWNEVRMQDFTYGRMDPDHKPHWTFRFIYRSRKVLEGLGIAPTPELSTRERAILMANAKASGVSGSAKEEMLDAQMAGEMGELLLEEQGGDDSDENMGESMGEYEDDIL